MTDYYARIVVSGVSGGALVVIAQAVGISAWFYLPACAALGAAFALVTRRQA